MAGRGVCPIEEQGAARQPRKGRLGLVEKREQANTSVMVKSGIGLAVALPPKTTPIPLTAILGGEEPR